MQIRDAKYDEENGMIRGKNVQGDTVSVKIGDRLKSAAHHVIETLKHTHIILSVGDDGTWTNIHLPGHGVLVDKIDSDTFLESLADDEHKKWSHWMAYLFSQGVANGDGSMTIPKDKVDRWQRQAATGYLDLQEDEKESDRAVVREFFANTINTATGREMLPTGRAQEHGG